MALENTERQTARPEQMADAFHDGKLDIGAGELQLRLKASDAQIKQAMDGISATFAGVRPELTAWVKAGFTDEMMNNSSKYPAYKAVMQA